MGCTVIQLARHGQALRTFGHFFNARRDTRLADGTGAFL